MNRIGLVSVTLNAVNPMTDYLSKLSNVYPINYLDSYIIEKVRTEGRMTDDCMRRMTTMIAHACEDGADGIIITCTIFSAYVSQFQKMFSVPIIGADTAMMDLVGKKGGKTALLCTFAGTKQPSTDLLISCFEKYHSEYELDTYVLDEAYQQAQQMNLKLHDEIIQKKIMELDESYENIVLAQISMSNAALDLKTKHAKVYTSPSAAYETLKNLIDQKKGN